MTFIKSTEIILKQNGNLPMTSRQIWDKIKQQNLINTKGKTPWASLNTILLLNSTNSNVKKRSGSFFEIVETNPNKFRILDYNPGYTNIEDKEDMEEVISLVKKAKYTGAFIIIWTSCSSDRFKEIKTYCNSKGLEIDGINQVPIDLHYGKDRKIYANIFLDDRAGLRETMAILETTMYKVRGCLRSNGYNVQDFDM